MEELKKDILLQKGNENLDSLMAHLNKTRSEWALTEEKKNEVE